MVRTSRLVGCILGGLTLVGCPPPQPTDPTLGPAPAGRHPELCEDACKRWQDMECPEGEPVCDVRSSAGECTKEISCVAWCQQTERDGPQSLNLECVVAAHATTCMALEDACAF